MPSQSDLMFLGPNDAARRILAALLRAHGYRVLATGDVAEARRAGERDVPWLLIGHFPPDFDSAPLERLLAAEPFEGLPFLLLEDTSPDAIERVVTDARRFFLHGQADAVRPAGIQGQVDRTRHQQAAALQAIRSRKMQLRAAQDAANRRAAQQVAAQRTEFLGMRDRTRAGLFPMGPPWARRPRFPGDDAPPFDWLRRPSKRS